MSDAPAPDGPAARTGDLTQGPILRTLVAFSVPMLIGNLIQTLNGSINAIWVGRLIGESALAATANANVVMFLLFAAIFGFGTATTVRVGQHFGAGDIEAARRTFGSGVGFCVFLAVSTSVLGWIYAEPLLRLLATPESILPDAIAYLRVTFIMMPFGTIGMMIGMGLRGAGDSKTPMHSMILTVVLDIVLNPLLILGYGPIPRLGIAGSALAAGIAGLAGMIFVVHRVYSRDLPLRLRGDERRYLLPGGEDLSYVVGKGLPMGAQMLLMSSAQVVMVGLVNREGMHSTAAYAASLQLWNYLQMPAFAISTAVSAMVAQNIGAGHHDRINGITKVGMLTNVVMTGLLATLLVVFARPLLGLFLGPDSPAIPIAVHIQHVITWSFIIMGAMMILSGTLRAYGVVVLPLIMQAVALYPVRVGFYFGAYPYIGSEALWWAFPVASTISALMTWLLYTRGSWRHRRADSFPAAGQPVPGENPG